MKRAGHTIGGVNFSTAFEEPIPGFEEAPYSSFAGEFGRPDVTHTLCRVTAEPGRARLGESETGLLRTCRSFRPEWLENPILPSPAVRDQLRLSLRSPESDLDLSADEHHVSIRDFSKREFHLFYTGTSGGYFPEFGSYLPEHYVKANMGPIFATFLTCFGAFLVHGAGLIMGGKAVLFLAPDEGGKSTVLESGQGHAVLSEDQVLLRAQNGAVTAHSTPLGGPSKGPASAEIGAIFLLEKAREFRISRVFDHEVISFICRDNLNRIFHLPKHLKARAFELFSKACSQAALRRMEFPKAHVEWEAIAEVVETHGRP